MKNTTILISALMLMAATTFAQTVNVTGISLNHETLNISAGMRNRSVIRANVMPDTATDNKVFWHSSNEGVATVWEDLPDYIIGVSPGTAIITATTRDGGFTATCKVTVTHVEAESISFNEETLDIIAGYDRYLETVVMPANASSEIIWSSSNEAVATISAAKTGIGIGNEREVDYAARINGISAGKAIITATTKDGGFSASCEVTVTNVAVEGISLRETLVANGIGEEYNLSAGIMPKNASNQEIIWSSSNEEVVTTINHTGGPSLGKIKVISAGTATITATAVDGGFTATCEVTVPIVEAEGISLEHETMDVNVGRESLIGAKIMPLDVLNREVVWSSSNEAVAIISSHRSTGVGGDFKGQASAYIKGVSPGKAIITATTADGGIAATCEVTVTYVAVESISLTRQTMDIQASATGDNRDYLGAFVTPANASTEIIWHSSNEAVAIIRRTTNENTKEYGREYNEVAFIRGLSAGTATITATTTDGNFTASCEVTVTYFPVTAVSLPETLDVSVGSLSRLSAEIMPVNASNREITWSSSNEAVATIDESGFIRGISAGTATITATTADGGFTATCEVTVTSIAVTGVSLPETMNIIVGDATTLRAEVTPANATNRQAIWSSSNEAVATVEYGSVRAISPGKATITATTVDGGFTATCEVTVTSIAVAGISLPETTDVSVGRESYLLAIVTPANATNRKIIWSSSNEAVATVDEYGRVQGISAGTATVTATTEDGGFAATCKVTVTYVPVTDVSLPETLNINAGYQNYLFADIIPVNASNRKVIWSSSNEAVATIDSNGYVHGISPGTATITVTTVEGSFTASCKVTVTNVAVTGISFGMETMEVSAGSKGYLSVTITPFNASNTEITWSSSDEAVATVGEHEYSSLGYGFAWIQGISAGTATITATTADGNFTATCEVTVAGTTGTEDVTNTPLAVYPNPTKGFVYLSTATYVQVYTLYGQLLYEGYTNTVDLTPLAQGVYILRADNESIPVIKE